MAGYGLGKTCATCGKRLDNTNESGYCRQHILQVAPTTDRLGQAHRRATKTETPLDTVTRLNTELRADLYKAMALIAKHEQQQRFEDRLLKEVQEFIQKSPYKPQLRPYAGKQPGAKASAHQMLVHVSDAHYPETVDPDQTFGIRYNGDICRRRLEYLRDAVIRFADLRRSSYPVDKLTVNVNGDMLSGNIYEELEIANEMPMPEAAVRMSYMLFDMGVAFAESFPQVEFIVMPGNHPRVPQKARFKARWNNWEWVMGKFVGALAGNRFKVTVPKDLVYQFNIFSQRIGVTHGDGQKVQSYAGIPFYGLEKRRTKLQALLKQMGTPQLDLLCYAHFHQLLYDQGQGCGVFINGSIKGGDEYSTGTAYSAQEPTQGLMTFHKTHGLTDLSRITLGHIQ